MTVSTNTSSSARDTILGRIREALRVAAPLPHMKSHATEESATAGPGGLTILPADVARPWLPDGGDTPEEQLALLTENLGKLRAEVHRAADLPADARRVRANSFDLADLRALSRCHDIEELLLAGLTVEAAEQPAAGAAPPATPAANAASRWWRRS